MIRYDTSLIVFCSGLSNPSNRDTYHKGRSLQAVYIQPVRFLLYNVAETKRARMMKCGLPIGQFMAIQI